MTRIASGLTVREVAGCPVVIGTGEAGSWFSGMVRLNETSLEVWHGLKDGLSDEEIARRLCAAYDVEAGAALEDVRAVVERLSAAGLLV